MFYKVFPGSEKYNKIIDFWNCQTEIDYILKIFVRNYFFGVTHKLETAYAESYIDSNFTKIASCPSYVNFD